MGFRAERVGAVRSSVRHVRDIADRLGVAERAAVDDYLTDQFMASLADSVVKLDGEHQQAMDSAGAMMLSVADAGGCRAIKVLGH